MKVSGDFPQKIKTNGRIPEGAILVTTDVVVLLPSISPRDGLEALQKRLNESDSTKVPAVDIVWISDLILKNNFFQFNDEVK